MKSRYILYDGVTRNASSTLGTGGAGLTVAEAFAYLARGALGLQVVDIRHPDVPRLVGLLNTPSEALVVTTAGDRLYVLDLVNTLQVVQGAGADLSDTDGDGVIDFFDAFLADPHEAQDTDRDGLGDQSDTDTDNDGFPDAAERQATPPTDPADARSFPVRLPPAGTTTLVVDAASTLPASQRTGAPEAPYRALSEALGPRGVVYAVELEPNLVTHLRERAEKERTANVVPVLASRDSPRLPAGRVDRIVLLDTYHHIDARVAYFGRLRTALAPGGRIVIVDWEKREDTMGPELSHRLAREQVEDEMRRAGYRQLETPARLGHQYVLVFTPA